MFVGHHDLPPVKGFQYRRPRRHLDDLPRLAAVEFHKIADRGLPLQQQNDARDEVGGDLLQAETDPHANRSTDHGKRGQADPHDVHQQQKGHAKNDEFRDLDRQLPDRGPHRLFADVAAGLAVGP